MVLFFGDSGVPFAFWCFTKDSGFLSDRCVFHLETVHNSAELSIYSLQPEAKTKNDPLQNSDEQQCPLKYGFMRSQRRGDRITHPDFSDLWKRELFVYIIASCATHAQLVPTETIRAFFPTSLKFLINNTDHIWYKQNLEYTACLWDKCLPL